MERSLIPLFPLRAVLFPGGPLKLRIFEPRYIDMIRRCMRDDSGFGVALIVAGQEVGGPARTVDVGTLARIVDFEKLPDGLLGITAIGERRFRIVSTTREADGLNVAQVEWLPVETTASIPAELSILAELLQHAFPQVRALYGSVVPQFDDANWVGMRLAELLPLPAPERQQCLELDDPLQRLRLIRERLDVRSTQM